MNDRFSEIKDKESYYFQFVQIDKRPCAIINFIISGVAFMNGIYFINIIHRNDYIYACQCEYIF